MSETITLARPYARAAFELAQDEHALDPWSNALGIASAVAGDPRMHGFLNDPRISQQDLVAMHLPPGIAADGAFARFLGELAHFRRLALLPEIAALFETLRREAKAMLKVRVTSAFALDGTEIERLRTSLKARFKREIELETAIDAALIGGVIIDTGNEVIDGSVRGGLGRLASALAH